MTYAQIGEAIGCAGSTVGDLASGRSQSPRAASAIALLKLHGGRLNTEATVPIEGIAALIDNRMTKRALRARFGFKTDAYLAVVLQLPTNEVESWPEEQSVPALPQVLRLLGVQEHQPVAQEAPHDPDADRIISVEAA